MIEAQLEWNKPTEAKPWRQAHLALPNVLTEHVLRIHPLLVVNRGGRDCFVLG